MEITLNQFKSLINGMSADEMINMIPGKIMRHGKPIYLDHFDNNVWFKSRNYKCHADYNLYYIDYKTREKFVSERANSLNEVYQKMLLRLLENNYLSDYQLITDD